MKQALAGLVLALAVLAACGGSAKPGTTKTLTCADAATHTHDLVMANPQADAGIADIMRTTIGERCSADGWSADAIACMATSTQDDMQACPNKLTEAQRDAFVSAVAAKTPEGGANPCGE